MGELRPWHIIVVALVFVVLFGAKRLPDSAKSVAKSLKIFKSELKDDGEGKSGKDSQN
ncbi:MAG: Sec-independent protein translocase subunit TatA [Actinomycetes bacterium]|jgi:sec-independent protein translocase protein TatA